jgi:hypothetical protein
VMRMCEGVGEASEETFIKDLKLELVLLPPRIHLCKQLQSWHMCRLMKTNSED